MPRKKRVYLLGKDVDGVVYSVNPQYVGDYREIFDADHWFNVLPMTEREVNSILDELKRSPTTRLYELVEKRLKTFEEKRQ